MKTKLLLFVSILTLFSCKTESCPNDWTRYESEEFSICYPDYWEVNTSGIYDSELVLIDMENIESKGFGRNVNIIKQHESFFPELKSLEDYAEFSKNQITAYLEDAKVFFFQPKNFSNIESYKLVMHANQHGRDLFFEQYFFQHNAHYYVLTFTTTQDDDPSMMRIGSQIVESLEMK